MTPPAVVEEGKQPPSWQLDGFGLRPLRSGDELAWHAYLSDPRVTLHTSFPDLDLDQVRRSVQRQIDESRSAVSCRWALTNPDDVLIGTCGFSNWSLPHAHAELVYDLAPAFWGRGLMSRAVQKLLSWAFLTAGFNRVHAVVMISNTPSIKLLERAGFSREGTLRQYRIARGQARDFHMYALLRQDYGT